MLSATNLTFVDVFVFIERLDFVDTEGIFDVIEAGVVKFGEHIVLGVGLVVHWSC